jgi:hypothetical protein
MTSKRRKLEKYCKSVRLKTMWAVDYDYLSKLTLEELEWLGHFTNWFYHGSPHKSGDLPITPELRKMSYTRNNNAESDLFTRKETRLIDIEIVHNLVDSYCEDHLIALIDMDNINGG